MQLYLALFLSFILVACSSEVSIDLGLQTKNAPAVTLDNSVNDNQAQASNLPTWNSLGLSYSSVEIFNNTAYIHQETPLAHSIEVFDLASDLSSSVQSITFDTNKILSFHVNATKQALFILTDNNKVHSYDLSNPQLPSLVDTFIISASSIATSMQSNMNGNILITYHSANLKSFIDISNITSLSFIAAWTLDFQQGLGALSADGQKVYFVETSDHSIRHYDLSLLPLIPNLVVGTTIVSNTPFFEATAQIKYDSDKLLVNKVAAPTGGVDVFDLAADDTSPPLLGNRTSTLDGFYFFTSFALFKAQNSMIYKDYDSATEIFKADILTFAAGVNSLDLGEEIVEVETIESQDLIVVLTKQSLNVINHSDLSVVKSAAFASFELPSSSDLYLIENENELLLLNDSTGITSLNLSLMDAPTIENKVSYAFARDFISTSPDGDLLFLSGGGTFGVQVYDNTDRSAPSLAGELHAPGTNIAAYDVVTTADKLFAFAVTSDANLACFDISDLSTITHTHSVSITTKGIRVNLSQDELSAYTLALDGFYKIDVSDKNGLSIIESYTTSLTNANDFKISDDESLAIISTIDQGVILLEIDAAPYSPLAVLDPDTNGAYSPILHNNSAVLFFYTDTLRDIYVYDISNPMAPNVLDQYTTNDDIVNIIKYNDYLIINLATGGLLYLDISDPSNIKPRAVN